MATVRKRTWAGGAKSAWACEYTDLAGRRRRKTFKSKHAADHYRLSVEGELAAGTHTAPRASITVEKALKQFLDDHKKRVTRGTYVLYERTARLHIIPYLGAVRLAALTGPSVQKYINDRNAAGLEPKVVGWAVRLLKQTISFAMAHGAVAQNVIHATQPRLPKVEEPEIEIPTKEEIRKVIAGSEGKQRAVICMAVFAGMRMGEIRALRWPNVDFETGVIRVRECLDRWNAPKKPKSKAGLRDIPMAGALRDILAAWRVVQRDNEGGFVFTTRLGGPYSYDGMHALWCSALNRVGLTDRSNPNLKGIYKSYGLPLYHFHALRHVCASLWIEQGVQPKQLQTWIGHKSIQLTFDTYGHLMGDQDDGAAAISRAADDLVPETTVVAFHGRDTDATTAANLLK